MTSSRRLPCSAAFAPATIGNVSVGFDILGMSIRNAGDRVLLIPRKDDQIVIQSIRGCVKSSVLPTDSAKNTASAALIALQKSEKIKFGFDVYIHKGIPLGSGMGGSAASAVAAVVAAGGLLKKKLPFEKQFLFALEGEKMASGASHPDNIAPCLKGGLTLSSLEWSKPVVSIPFLKSMGWVLVHPDIVVETKQARGILSPTITQESWVHQSARLGSFLAGFYKKDLELIAQGFSDTIIEPQRAHLIPGFYEIKKQVISHRDVLGFSISGSGPSVFALTKSIASAKKVAKQIEFNFKEQGISSQDYYGVGAAPGANLLPRLAAQNLFKEFQL